MNIIEWFWGLLPDKCEMPDCRRENVRGNENVVDDKIMCDGCHSRYMEQRRRVWLVDNQGVCQTDKDRRKVVLKATQYKCRNGHPLETGTSWCFRCDQ